MSDDPLDVYWTIPVRGDHSARGRRGFTSASADPLERITDLRPGRFTDFDHLVQVARAAESTGFAGLVVPYDPHGEESWVVASALAAEVPRVKIVPELQPGFATAVYTAKMALCFQRYFADRLGWKLALDTSAAAQRTVGDLLPEHRRVDRARELLEVIDGVWNGSGFDQRGEFFEVQGGGLFEPTAPAGGYARQIGRRRSPQVVLDGMGAAELALSADRADVHLFDLDDPGVLAGLVERHRALAAERGRTVRYGVRAAVLARHTADEAWRESRRLWARDTSGTEVDHDARRADAVRWTGFDRLGLPGSAGLVGSFDEVATHLGALGDLGFSVVVLDAVDHLADAYRVGEFVLTQLDRAPVGV